MGGPGDANGRPGLSLRVSPSRRNARAQADGRMGRRVPGVQARASCGGHARIHADADERATRPHQAAAGTTAEPGAVEGGATGGPEGRRGVTRQCSFEGCKGQAEGRGLCSMHRQRWRKLEIAGLPTSLEAIRGPRRPGRRVRTPVPCRVAECTVTASTYPSRGGYCVGHYSQVKSSVEVTPLGHHKARRKGNRRWTARDDAELRAAFARGDRVRDIGRSMGRTFASAWTRCHVLGLYRRRPAAKTLERCPHCHLLLPCRSCPSATEYAERRIA
jgi:hypothetical protein